jgi:Ribonuclease G/E
MKINNKFDIGETVVYPAADLGHPRLMESEITGVSLWVNDVDDDEKETIVYRTKDSYGVTQKHMAKTAKTAKKKLLDMMKDKEKQITKQVREAIKAVEDMSPKELLEKAPADVTDPMQDL